jgi:hypothetical protein
MCVRFLCVFQIVAYYVRALKDIESLRRDVQVWMGYLGRVPLPTFGLTAPEVPFSEVPSELVKASFGLRRVGLGHQTPEAIAANSLLMAMTPSHELVRTEASSVLYQQIHGLMLAMVGGFACCGLGCCAGRCDRVIEQKTCFLCFILHMLCRGSTMPASGQLCLAGSLGVFYPRLSIVLSSRWLQKRLAWRCKIELCDFVLQHPACSARLPRACVPPPCSC